MNSAGVLFVAAVAGGGLAEVCRCHLPLDVPEGRPCLWPQHDSDPAERVLAVASWNGIWKQLSGGRWHRRG